MSANIFVFSTFVFTEAFPPDGLPEYGIPAALGTMMVFVAIALTLWYVQMLRRSQRYQVITGKGYRAKQIDAFEIGIAKVSLAQIRFSKGHLT